MQNIFSTIRREVDDFIYNDISPVDGYSFNQYETIKRIHLYDNSRFESDYTPYDIPKIFANIVSWRRDAMARFLQFKTQDYRIRPLNPISKMSTRLLEKELQQFLKKNNIDQLEVETADELATYGSAVWKKTKNGAKIVDLRNLFIDPSVDYIEKSRFITIKYTFTPSRLRKVAKENKWDMDEVEALISRVENSLSPEQSSYKDDKTIGNVRSTAYIEVFERWGEVDKEWITGKAKDRKELTPAVMIVAEPYMTSQKTGDNNEAYEIEEGAILYKSEWKKAFPFIDMHVRKTKGRWLGIGAIEPLFPAQERWNEMVNQKRVAMEISSIHLFQTNDKSIVSNILTDLRSGDVIKTTQPNAIQPVANEERNLSAFRDEQTVWNDIAERISHSSDLITGNDIPASTPATNAVIQNTNASSVFNQMRDRIAARKRVFYVDEVLPQLLHDLKDEHILKYAGEREEILEFDNVFKENVKRKAFLQGILEMKVITQVTLDEIGEMVGDELQKQGSERFVNVKEHFYDDLEFEFDINITNEQENLQVTSQNLFQVFTALAQNPQILQDPVLRSLFDEYAQKIGVSPAKIELASRERQRMQTEQSQPQQPQMQQPQPLA